ncbi:hypothetical protein EYF80_026818 [Liparis tanakae]|uniref:Uncharacterized protein n=1 Tax=Liparis tanakae TaxID=230148 RepID=A0A4Z2HAN3_9TELE|nr:hypothetical protein EYF80_026818 [Liparis tanakae]
MEMKPLRAGQKSWALVLSPCTSSQLRHCLYEGEHRKNQVTGQQRKSLHAAAQSRLESLGVLGRFYGLGNPKSLHQEAQTDPLVPHKNFEAVLDEFREVGLLDVTVVLWCRPV